MGRSPGTIQDRLFQMRISEDFLKAIDKWRARQPDLPSRAEAMRRLTTMALEASKKASPKKTLNLPQQLLLRG